MKTNHQLIALLAGITLCWSSCTSTEDIAESVAATPVVFSAGIAGIADITRTNSDGSAWAANDAVGIYMLTAGTTTIATDGANAKYTITDATSGAMSHAVAPLYYPQSGTVDFIAYYPYSATATTDADKVTISFAGQTSEAEQCARDLLYSKNATGKDKTSATINLQFAHALAKLKLNIVFGDGLTALAADKLTAVTLSGMPASATLSLTNGTITAGTNGDFAPLAIAAEQSSMVATYTAIIAPQAAGSSRQVKFTVDGADYAWSIPDDITFVAGKLHTYTVTVKKTGVEASNPDITDWTSNNNGTNGNAVDLTPNIVMDAPTGIAAPRIYLSGTSGDSNSSLQLTKDPTNLGLFFKFGSVVGISSDISVNKTFETTDVIFNPTYDADNSGAPYSITDWGDINYYSSDDWNNGETNVSAATYHTLDNLKIGKGDPCKLVGYTLSQIKTMLKNGLVPDNKTWRLPTNNDASDSYSNVAFAGDANRYSNPGDWGTISVNSIDVKGRYFPKNSGNTGIAGVFLPAAGYRIYDNGAICYVDTFGHYWSSTVLNSSDGYNLYFSSSFVYPQNIDNFSDGFSIRCVPQLVP